MTDNQNINALNKVPAYGKTVNSKCRLLWRSMVPLMLIWLFAAASNLHAETTKVILDTDMLTDPEDVNALWLLNALADRGEAQILACVVDGHDENRASGAAVDVVNTWFGRSEIPIGTFKGGYPIKRSPFTTILRDNFPHRAPSDDKLPSALDVYRRVLSQQPDHSVVIVSIGFLTNLGELVHSGPDQYSSLTGKDLIRAKVKELVVMGGAFPKGCEHNLSFDKDVTKVSADTFENWPKKIPVVFSGYEIGKAVISGKSYKEKLPDGPLKIALQNNAYGALLNGRESWDETAVMYAVRGLSFGGNQYWTMSKPGQISMNLTNGFDSWVDASDGNQTYLILSMPPAKIGQILEDLVLNDSKRKTLAKASLN